MLWKHLLWKLLSISEKEMECLPTLTTASFFVLKKKINKKHSRTFQLQVFGLASLISWARQPILDWQFRAFQTCGTASFRRGSLKMLNQLTSSLVLKGEVWSSIFRNIAAMCFLLYFSLFLWYLLSSPPNFFL